MRGLPFRINHLSWWEEELPNKKELWEGWKNLAANDYKIDYVITHCCGTKTQETIGEKTEEQYLPDILTEYFQELEGKIEYKHWYFGHYHQDMKIDGKHTVLYHGIIALDEDISTKRIPILGEPKYTYKDIVRFSFKDKIKEGKISIIDAYGTFEQNEEPSYDIYVEEENCLYKHICESDIIEE